MRAEGSEFIHLWDQSDFQGIDFQNDVLELSLYNLLDVTDELCDYAEKIEVEEGLTVIVCHGNPFELGMILYVNGSDDLELAFEFDWDVSEISSILRAESNWYNDPVVLLACQAGAFENGVAQWLADDLKVPVSACKEDLFLCSNGMYYVSDRNVQTWRDPILTPDGQWHRWATFYAD